MARWPHSMAYTDIDNTLVGWLVASLLAAPFDFLLSLDVIGARNYSGLLKVY